MKFPNLKQDKWSTLTKQNVSLKLEFNIQQMQKIKASNKIKVDERILVKRVIQAQQNKSQPYKQQKMGLRGNRRFLVETIALKLDFKVKDRNNELQAENYII